MGHIGPAARRMLPGASIHLVTKSCSMPVLLANVLHAGAANSPNAFHYKQRSGQPVSASAGLPLIHRKYLSLSHSTWSGNLVLSEL